MSNKNNDGRIPALRFPGFRDAGPWEEKRLGEVYSFYPTNSFSRDKLNYDMGSIKTIHYGDIHTKFSTLFNIGNEEVPFVNPDQVPENINPDNFCAEADVIFADASEDLNDVGKSIEVVYLGDEKILSGLHTILARQIEARLVVGFGGYLFKSSGIRKKIQHEAQGAKVLGISKGRLGNITICYPKEKEQQKIADCLTSLDDLITAHSQKLDGLKAHKKGLMQQLFPREGETRPALRFPGFQDAGPWEEKRLGEVGKFVGGGTPDTSMPDYWGGTTQWFTPTEIKQRYLSKSKRTITELGLKKSSANLLPKEALLISTRATVGDVGIAQGPCATNQGFQSLCVYETEVIAFWYYWISQHKEELLRRSSGSTFLEIGKNEIKKVEIYRPLKPEQQKIADCLTSLDDLITAHRQKLDGLKAHKKGLMQQLFPQPATPASQP